MLSQTSYWRRLIAYRNHRRHSPRCNLREVYIQCK
nr:MAG TPA: hypothetical protein [Caudoviricetes sp.]